MILEHKHKLCQQLHETADHALTLHLVVLIVFTTITGNIIHASGKFVSQIHTHLLMQANVGDQIATLTKYHGKFIQKFLKQSSLYKLFSDAVLKLLQAAEDSEEYKSLTNELNTLQKDVKTFAVNFERPGTTKAD